MCGIVGILGRHEVAPLLVEALKRLEYRGYDSAGVACIDNGRLERRRAVGKLINLSDLLVRNPLPGRTGIGHTRWATHGPATEANAHPHMAGRVAVVHNGIIENFKELRAELAAAGIGFETDTDTEVVALLTQKYLDEGLDPADAAFRAIDRLAGAFALAFIFEGEDDLMVAARKGSPLAIGHGDGEMYVGSDAIALAQMTNRITYLEEGDRAIITRAGARIFDADGRPVTRPVERIAVDDYQIAKGGYRHYMAKEIAEQPKVVETVLESYADLDALRVRPERFGIDFAATDRVLMVACGTAFYACQIARYWFEQIGGIPADVDIGSEFRYRDPIIAPRTAAMFVSQSGETADTLAALRHARDRAARTAAIVNVETSTIAREADITLPILAGPEVGVASTKAFTAQLAVLALAAIHAGRQRGHIDAAREAELIGALRELPALLSHALALGERIRALSEEISLVDDVLFLGRGPLYPLAMEGALKLKEISYIHAEGYASGELKHGPIALVDETLPVVVIAPRDALFDKTISNMNEVMARHGRIILVTDPAGAREAGQGVWRDITLPEAHPFVAPLLYAVPLQLLAYHTALHKGTDVDQPRNLAKSVTVE
ncbi:MAG: glutamine--fructose-6-phosphate transaminase (isomerizing) [Alphaproteobacteria bacterium]|nr:MAG: glutamine--fructose-6-phosphate transaminase (isomerizing) [Alphaproteobacteria bacterium]